MSRLQTAMMQARASRFPVRLPPKPAPAAAAPPPPPTTDQLLEILKAAPTPMMPANRVHHIQNVVASHYGLERKELLSIRRTKPLVTARQTAMYIAKLETDRSLPYIGRMFGGRDHTTALHAIRKMERRAADDSAYAAEVEALRELLHRREP